MECPLFRPVPIRPIAAPALSSSSFSFSSASSLSSSSSACCACSSEKSRSKPLTWHLSTPRKHSSFCTTIVRGCQPLLPAKKLPTAQPKVQPQPHPHPHPQFSLLRTSRKERGNRKLLRELAEKFPLQYILTKTCCHAIFDTDLHKKAAEREVALQSLGWDALAAYWKQQKNLPKKS
eukprot:TRINITY_DN1250_c0_g1_i1.p1 TRINITY_DN1250_c0_g1~~TRINITY_DN1250_c0_g1_i1.p1  ORF type:complete len:177 (-),score=43.73 TRINITY_DN1250_c0_g1_i1:215-745(-)